MDGDVVAALRATTSPLPNLLTRGLPSSKRPTTAMQNALRQSLPVVRIVALLLSLIPAGCDEGHKDDLTVAVTADDLCPDPYDMILNLDGECRCLQPGYCLSHDGQQCIEAHELECGDYPYECGPLAQGCAPLEGCYFDSILSIFTCEDIGATPGSLAAPCDPGVKTSCQPELTCLPGYQVPDCDDSYCCSEWCREGRTCSSSGCEESHSCSATERGASCEPLTYFAAVPGLASLGVCRIPASSQEE